MRFNPGANLDPSQISDRRGMGFGGGGMGMPMRIGGGGGVIGLIFLVITLLNGGGGTTVQSADPFGGQYAAGSQTAGATAAQCRTGEDANARQDCRIVGVVNSVQAHWARTLPNYRPAETVLFTQATQSGCGAADASTGPFYCPADETIYMDLSFFQLLQSRFGASGGPFGEAYVIAHEYGHHLEKQLGILNQRNAQSPGANGGSVRAELMADCLAGAWARGAVSTGFILELTEQDIADGMSAAAAVGDDRIQTASQGRTSPETYTHGTAEQRQRWFMNGYRNGTVDTCNTFRSSRL